MRDGECYSYPFELIHTVVHGLIHEHTTQNTGKNMK